MGWRELRRTPPALCLQAFGVLNQFDQRVNLAGKPRDPTEPAHQFEAHLIHQKEVGVDHLQLILLVECVEFRIRSDIQCAHDDLVESKRAGIPGSGQEQQGFVGKIRKLRGDVVSFVEAFFPGTEGPVVENPPAICFEIDDLSHFWIGNYVMRCGAAASRPAIGRIGAPMAFETSSSLVASRRAMIVATD